MLSSGQQEHVSGPTLLRASLRGRDIITVQRQVDGLYQVIDTSLTQDDVKGPLDYNVVELEATRARVQKSTRGHDHERREWMPNSSDNRNILDLNLTTQF